LFFKLSKREYFYDSTSAFCAPKAVFGKTCFSTDQCQTGLVCSTQGSLQNVCLKDIGASCGAKNECVNFLPCVNGICDCFVTLFSSNFFSKFKLSI